MPQSHNNYSTSRDHFWWFVFAMIGVLFLGLAVGDAVDDKWGQSLFDLWMVLFCVMFVMLGIQDTRRQHSEVVPDGPYAQTRTRYNEWVERKVHARPFDIIARISIIVLVVGILVFWRVADPLLLIPPAVALLVILVSTITLIVWTRRCGREYEATHGIEDTWIFNIDETDLKAISDAETMILTEGKYPEPDDAESEPESESEPETEPTSETETSADAAEKGKKEDKTASPSAASPMKK